MMRPQTREDRLAAALEDVRARLSHIEDIYPAAREIIRVVDEALKSPVAERLAK